MHAVDASGGAVMHFLHAAACTFGTCTPRVQLPGSRAPAPDAPPRHGTRLAQALPGTRHHRRIRCWNTWP